MKKIILGLVLLGNIAFAQTFGKWNTGEIKDEWNEPTGIKYISTSEGNTFLRLKKEKNGDIEIMVNTNTFLETESKVTDIYFKMDTSKENFGFIGFYWGNQNTHAVSATKLYNPFNEFTVNEMIEEMKKANRVKVLVHDYNDVNVLSEFSLNGFTKAYNYLNSKNNVKKNLGGIKK